MLASQRWLVANDPIVSILAYSGSSVLMMVTNKYAVSGTEWNLSFLLVAIQAVICTIVISIGKAMGMISFRDLDLGEVRQWYPVSLLLVGMLYTSAKALQYLSIPVYTIFKSLTIILIAYGEVLWFSASVTYMELLSFGLMALSSIIAAWADISHALSDTAARTKISKLNSGYVWMGLNCICSAGYVLGMRKGIEVTGFNDFDVTFYNNLLVLPVLLFLSIVVEDWSSANFAINFPAGRQAKMISAIVFTGLSSILMSYTSAWCIRVLSPTTFSMVGALNKLPVAISGWIFFEVPVAVASVSAVLIAFISGIIYAAANMP